jgi:ParB family chromosome partitioning protein
MASKEKRKHLGMGLEALLGPISTPVAAEQKSEIANKSSKYPDDKGLRDSVHQIPIVDIVANPYQPRTVWKADRLEELTKSIRANGVIQPILVRKVNSGYEVIAGERRLRASQEAGLMKVPALVRVASDDEMLELALVENIHRSDLNPLERAVAYQRFVTTFSLTQSDAAERLGESRSVIANHLRLLDLPKEIKEMLSDGQLSMGHARAILALPTDELRRKLANRAMAGRLSVREVERLVRKYIEGSKTAKAEPASKPAHIVDLENKLRESLGTKVRIDTNKKGQKGKIIIDFYSLDDFDKLADRIGIEMSSEV